MKKIVLIHALLFVLLISGCMFHNNESDYLLEGTYLVKEENLNFYVNDRIVCFETIRFEVKIIDEKEYSTSNDLNVIKTHGKDKAGNQYYKINLFFKIYNYDEYHAILFYIGNHAAKPNSYLFNIKLSEDALQFDFNIGLKNGINSLEVYDRNIDKDIIINNNIINKLKIDLCCIYHDKNE